ncbi:hypothetical protein PROVRETT_09468 [Providencia rettgeri DSM 1131]|nr:hypothetical protein PROVRETT_09468 [Providencia rettgeri DSM 1131]
MALKHILRVMLKIKINDKQSVINIRIITNQNQTVNKTKKNKKNKK